MAVTGAFPGFKEMMRRTIPSPVNPLDKCTIISIFPKDIKESKPTMIPNEWFIPKGTWENPSVTHIGPASWWKDVGDDQPLIEIPVSSLQIADSIIKDYCNGYLGCDMDGAMPGLFFVPGGFNLDKIRKDYSSLLDRTRARQNSFWQALVGMADSYWSRTGGNPRAISDDMRLAAKELGLEKDWANNYQPTEVVKCVACGEIRNPLFPVCPHCKAVVDPKKAEALGLTFVK